MLTAPDVVSTFPRLGADRTRIRAHREPAPTPVGIAVLPPGSQEEGDGENRIDRVVRRLGAAPLQHPGSYRPVTVKPHAPRVDHEPGHLVEVLTRERRSARTVAHRPRDLPAGHRSAASPLSRRGGTRGGPAVGGSRASRVPQRTKNASEIGGVEQRVGGVFRPSGFTSEVMATPVAASIASSPCTNVPER
jgi:hypothetical protein